MLFFFYNKIVFAELLTFHLAFEEILQYSLQWRIFAFALEHNAFQEPNVSGSIKIIRADV